MRAQAKTPFTFITNSGQTGPFISSQSLATILPGLDPKYLSFVGDFAILPENTGIEPVRRLVVLVSNNDFDELELARRIWHLANPALSVLFMCLSSTPDSYLRHIRPFPCKPIRAAGAPVAAHHLPVWTVPLTQRHRTVVVGNLPHTSKCIRQEILWVNYKDSSRSYFEE